jgi:hypothetical protein
VQQVRQCIFFALGMEFLIEAIKNMPYTEKIDFLRIAPMIFSTALWKNKLNSDIFNFSVIISKLKSRIKIVLFSLL